MNLEELDNAKEVEKWINSFRKLIKKCPKNLWFFSGCSDGCIHIMCHGKDGEAVYTKEGSVDSDYMIDDVCGGEKWIRTRIESIFGFITKKEK